MDNTPEDWEEKLRIKREIEKAEHANAAEDKGNLAYMDTATFKEKKGFTRDPEAFRRTGERMGNTGIVLVILGFVGAIITALLSKGNSSSTSYQSGAIGTAIGILDTIFVVMIYISPILAIDAIASTVMYWKKTGKKSQHMIITGVAIITVVVISIFVRKWILE